MAVHTLSYSVFLAVALNAPQQPVSPPLQPVEPVAIAAPDQRINQVHGVRIISFPTARLAKWQDVALKHQGAMTANGPRWDALVSRLKEVPRDQALAWVNKEVNTVRYVPDRLNWGHADYWAAPKEFLERGGDCEDYAILKYYLLSEAGFTPNQMQISFSQDHAVLIVSTEDGPIILDNRKTKPYRLKRNSMQKIVFTVNDIRWTVVLG